MRQLKLISGEARQHGPRSNSRSAAALSSSSITLSWTKAVGPREAAGSARHPVYPMEKVSTGLTYSDFSREQQSPEAGPWNTLWLPPFSNGRFLIFFFATSMSKSCHDERQDRLHRTKDNPSGLSPLDEITT